MVYLPLLSLVAEGEPRICKRAGRGYVYAGIAATYKEFYAAFLTSREHSNNV